VGDVAVATEEVFGDEGVEESGGFRDFGAIGLVAARREGEEVHNVVPVTALREEAWAKVRRQVAGRFQVVRGRLVTVSTASGTEARAREMELRWDPLAESMEGAAAALACFLEGIPFLEVRGITNRVGDRYRDGWDLETALSRAAEVAAALLAEEVART
jgi:futalosine hydrolase